MKQLYPTNFTFTFRLLFLYRNTSLFLLIFFLNIALGFGQGVTISSPQEPGPTDANPIEVLFEFSDAVNQPITGSLGLDNATVLSEERLIPAYENFNSLNLPTRNIQASVQDFLLNYFQFNPFDFSNSYNEQFQQQLQEYLTEKFKNLIVAFDINSNEEIYYLTFANGVFKYNVNSSDQQVIPPDEFESPIDILIDNEDRILVADNDAYSVKVFGPLNYTQLFEIGGDQGADSDEFYGPTGLAKNANNDIYVVDTYPKDYEGDDDPEGKVVDKVKVYQITDEDFEYIDFFGKNELDDPFRLAIDLNNNVYVSDSGGSNGRIRIFNSDGILKRTIASSSKHSPASIAIDSFGYIYVADYNGDITFNGIYQNPLDLLSKFDVLKGNTYSIDVYKPLSDDFNTQVITTFEEELKLPIDLTLNNCENILVLDLDFGGEIDNADFDFDIEMFRRNDKFKLLVEPNSEGIVELELDSPNLFKCGPQPEGVFSIDYETEEELDPIVTCPGDSVLDELELGENCNYTLPEIEQYIQTENLGDEDFTVTDENIADNILTVEVEVLDGEELIETCELRFQLVDETPPVINCPENITREIPAGEDSIEINYDLPEVSDNCSENLTPFLIAGPESGTEFEEGTYTIEFQVTDDADNIETCDFTITVTQADAEPIVTCPGNSVLDELELGDNCNYTLPEIEQYIQTENFGDDIFTIIDENINDNILSVEVEVLDGEELIEICELRFELVDQTPPTISCPQNITREIPVGEDSIVINYNLPEVSDNCSENLIPELINGPESGSEFEEGTYTIEFQVTDDADNIKTCDFTITVTQEEPAPYNFECIGELTVNLGEEAQNLPVVEIPTSEFIASATSNLNFVLDKQQFTCDDIGTNPVIIRATNKTTGEEYDCTVNVTVQDVGAPLIICPAEPITINLPEEGYKVEDFFENRISDNCNSLEELELVQDVEPGTVLEEAGTYTINLTATDTYNNVETCEITIKLIPENSAPIANPDAYSTEVDTPLNISAAEGVLANDSDPDGDALIAIPNQDVTGGTLTLNEDGSFSYVPDTGFTGSDTFTYFAFDGEIQVETTVSIVVAPNDSGAPVANDDFYSLNENEELQISAPGILRNDSDPEDRELVPSVTANTSNGTLVLSSDGAFVYTPNPDFSGTDSFSYLVNNGEQNSNVATVTLSVEPLPNDAPIALPDSYSVLENGELIVNAPGVMENDYDPDGDPFTAILLDLPTQGTIDFNPDGSFTYISNSGYTGPDSFTYMLNDEKNFSNEVTVTITVNARNPVPQFEDCPTLIQRNVSTGECEALVMFDVPTASDDSGELTVNLVSELGSGDLFPVGTTTVTYEATGENGERITCSFEVMVVDNIPPSISCPGDQIENFDPETGFEVPNYESWATFSDNCGEVSFRQEPEAGEIIYEDTTVQLFAEDANEQVASCSFELQLTEANVLNIFCQIDQNVSADEDCSFTLPDYIDTAEVSLPGANVTQSPPEGTVINENTQVKLTATLNGETDECFFMVNLVDNEDPVANCVSGYVVNLDESGNATLAPEMLDNNSTDNCGIVSMALSQINFTRADVGEVPITLTVRDDAGNMDTCETTVEVIDENSGEFECRENVVVNLNENGEAALSLQELYTGNASGLTLEASRLNFSCSDLGMVQIQLDYSGAQTGSCTINVEVRDEIPPFINTDIVELTLDNEGFAYLEEGDVLAENNCGQQFIYRFSKSVFNCEDVGLNTVNVEVEDASGNIAEKNIEVRVNGEACEIPDNEDLKFLFIYPNPNNGTFTITTPEGMQVEQVRVFDSRGRFILQKEYKDIARFYRMTIEGVAASVYTLQIFTNEGVVVKRVIISQ